MSELDTFFPGTSEERKALLPPPPKPKVDVKQFIMETGWFVVVFPDTDMHHALAKRLAESKPGQLIPLSPDEMALLAEFMPWPNR